MVAMEMKKGLQTKIMRPPYGSYDKRVRKIVHSLGFKIAYWTIDSFDWRGISAKEITWNVVPNLHKGACILMHLNAPHTLEALPAIIAGIRERGLELCYDGTEISV
jgi:peptidoglycan/xylan/chitin deacetylase (PgdA/CDA1 family)